MALSRRHKIVIILLIFYWPALFVLAHIPIPQAVRESGVSDKSLHIIAYLNLVFLLWFAIKPEKKVNWRRASAWWILLIVVGYGLCDEWLQGRVGSRSADISDFFADLAGAVASLGILSVFSFWPASIVVTSATIFFLTNFSGAKLLTILPYTNTAFHLFAFALLTMLWIQCIYQFLPLKPSNPKWLMTALALPIGFLLPVKFISLFTRKTFALTDTIVSLIGIVAVVLTISMITLLRQKLSTSQKFPVNET
jgi:VanZ family protein